jgi:cytochrome c
VIDREIHMDFFEINKIAGALIGCLAIVMGVNFVSGAIFDKPDPETPGWAIPVATAAAPAAGGAAPAAAEVKPITVRLASASSERGEDVFKKCGACHTKDNGGAQKTGPNLWNVVNGPKAHISGFNYSGALAERGAKGEKWGFAELDQFLENPKGYVAGTKMAFAGIKSPEERADLIAYLRSLSDNPAPIQ